MPETRRREKSGTIIDAGKDGRQVGVEVSLYWYLWLQISSLDINVAAEMEEGRENMFEHLALQGT